MSLGKRGEAVAEREGGRSFGSTFARRFCGEAKTERAEQRETYNWGQKRYLGVCVHLQKGRAFRDALAASFLVGNLKSRERERKDREREFFRFFQEAPKTVGVQADNRSLRVPRSSFSFFLFLSLAFFLLSSFSLSPLSLSLSSALSSFILDLLAQTFKRPVFFLSLYSPFFCSFSSAYRGKEKSTVFANDGPFDPDQC